MNTTVNTVKIPWLPVANIFIQNEWLILSQNTNCINTRIYTVRKREIDDTIFTAKRNCRFCQILGQSI